MILLKIIIVCSVFRWKVGKQRSCRIFWKYRSSNVDVEGQVFGWRHQNVRRRHRQPVLHLFALILGIKVVDVSAQVLHEGKHSTGTKQNCSEMFVLTESWIKPVNWWKQHRLDKPLNTCKQKRLSGIRLVRLFCRLIDLSGD